MSVSAITNNYPNLSNNNTSNDNSMEDDEVVVPVGAGSRQRIDDVEIAVITATTAADDDSSPSTKLRTDKMKINDDDDDDDPDDDDAMMMTLDQQHQQKQKQPQFNHKKGPILSEAENQQLQEQAALVVDEQLRAMAVSSTSTRTCTTTTTTNATARAHHDQAPSTATSTGTRSAGESVDDGSNHLRPFVRSRNKFESGSGSGDQDGMVSMEDGMDVAAKKRKTRRGKPKHRKLKPYSSKQQMSYQQRLRNRAATGRPNKTGRQPPAPYNTTQFLIDDHNDLPDLDEKIAATGGGSAAVTAMATVVHTHFSKPVAPPRTRDSSFSIDSDDDYFYSSPEDEEEFLTKEFSTAYEDLHAERLGAMTKPELIQEYIQLEAKVDLLTKRLRKQNQANNQVDASSADRDPAEPRAGDSEYAKKLKSLQQRIDELQQQNEQLRRENEMMRNKQRHGSPMSSVDSESDSDSSHENGSNCSGCNYNKTSPGSSPVPASYHAGRREKTTNRRKNSSVSSVDSESDSTTGESSCDEAADDANASPRNSAGNSNDVTPAAAASNGHATSQEIDGLPT